MILILKKMGPAPSNGKIPAVYMSYFGVVSLTTTINDTSIDWQSIRRKSLHQMKYYTHLNLRNCIVLVFINPGAFYKLSLWLFPYPYKVLMHNKNNLL